MPLATLPNTHNGHPLMLTALGAHTKLMAIYLMSVYGDPKIRREFTTAYKKTGKRLDMTSAIGLCPSGRSRTGPHQLAATRLGAQLMRGP